MMTTISIATPIQGMDINNGNYFDRASGEFWRNIYEVKIDHNPGQHADALREASAEVEYIGSTYDTDEKERITAWGESYKTLCVKAYNPAHAFQRARLLIAGKLRQLDII